VTEMEEFGYDIIVLILREYCHRPVCLKGRTLELYCTMLTGILQFSIAEQNLAGQYTQ
jgi:hypothetical protein